MPQLHTQPPSKYSPPVYVPDDPESPLQRLRKDVRNVARPASKSNLPRDRIMASDDKVFGIYQYLVQQNPGTHLDGGIEEDGKWK